MIRKLHGLFVLSMSLLVEAGFACDQAPMQEALENAIYSGVEEHPVRLTDGRWEGPPYAEGGASRPAVGLVKNFSLHGDLDGDGADEIVVLLWQSSGGSGTFDYLAVMGRKDGAVRNLATAAIGDRAQY